METLNSTRTGSWLPWFLRGLLLLGFLLLLGRLTELQIIKGEYYSLISEDNRIRRIPISAPRGKILARGGEILVDNQEIDKYLKFSPELGYEKVDMVDNPTDGEVIKEWRRFYPLGDKFAHVSGYLGEINEEELNKINPACPEKGPRSGRYYLGRSGLEEEYECYLSGIEGEELVEVDTQGKKVRTLGKKEPISGQDLKTTIDYGLQVKVAEVMSDKKGAVVVTDTRGEILAMYSAPSFDPNLFLDKDQGQKLQSLFTDPDLPLFNRAIGGRYHPGSVFKPLVALAALEEEKMEHNFIYEDIGVIRVGEFSYNNWYFTQYGSTEGKIDLVRAIARSTDTFFYKVGEMAGINNIVKWAQNLKLDQETGIDLPGEIAGLVPTPEWKLKTKGERWYLGNTYHVSIGQGDLGLTLLEVNQITSLISSGGDLCKPHLWGTVECNNLGIDKSHLDLIREGMAAACAEGGTGYTFFDFQPPSACKTGTAETSLDEKTHAWFTVFAPVKDPEIVTTVLVEEGGEGSKVAGPIAREIFNYWFKTENSEGDIVIN